MNATKRCAKCKAEKPRSEFTPTKRPNGLHAYCHECMAAKTREWRNRNPQYRREYEQRNRERIKAARAARRSVPGYRHTENLRRKFGMTHDDYLIMLAHQDGVCAICRHPSEKTYHVDHCHATGKVRGLLCGSCNKALGLLRDNPKRLCRAIEYLTEYPRADFLLIGVTP